MNDVPAVRSLAMSALPAQEPMDARTYFAAERTQLAWIRTGLALMGFGFVVARFGLFLREIASVRGQKPVGHGSLSLVLGIALVLVGVAVNVLSAIRQWIFIGGFAAPSLPKPGWFWKVAVGLSILLAGFGLAMAIYLIVVG